MTAQTPRRTQYKAIMAGLVAGLAYAVPVVDDGLMPSEGLAIALAVLTGWQAVYWTRDKERRPRRNSDKADLTPGVGK